jgi:ribosomal protein S27E
MTPVLIIGSTALAIGLAGIAIIAREMQRLRVVLRVRCPACDAIRVVPGGVRFLRCQRCGYVMLNGRGKTGPDPSWVPGDLV